MDYNETIRHACTAVLALWHAGQLQRAIEAVERLDGLDYAILAFVVADRVDYLPGARKRADWIGCMAEGANGIPSTNLRAIADIDGARKERDKHNGPQGKHALWVANLPSRILDAPGQTFEHLYEAAARRLQAELRTCFLYARSDQLTYRGLLVTLERRGLARRLAATTPVEWTLLLIWLRDLMPLEHVAAVIQALTRRGRLQPTPALRELAALGTPAARIGAPAA